MNDPSDRSGGEPRDRGRADAGAMSGLTWLATLTRNATAELALHEPPARVAQAMHAAYAAKAAANLSASSSSSESSSSSSASASASASVRATPLKPAGAPRRAGWRTWLLSGAGVCAAVLLGSLVLLLLAPDPPRQDARPGTGLEAATTADPASQSSGFMSIAPAARWSAVLADTGTAGRGPAPAWVVATEMPRERLAALGLPYDPARAGERVRAELLMHPSGDVLAVRVLH